MNKRAKEELADVWTDKFAVAMTTVVVIPIVLYFLNKFGLFEFEPGTWQDIKYIVTGPLFFFVGVAYAPVWITCAIYLLYLVIKSIITIIRVIARSQSNDGPKTVSRKELVDILKNE